MNAPRTLVLAFLFVFAPLTQARATSLSWIELEARTREARTLASELGFAIDAVRSDSVWGLASPAQIRILKEHGFRVLSSTSPEFGRGFPAYDADFHDYAEPTDVLKQLAAKFPTRARLQSIGKSLEGRELWGLHLNTTAADLESGQSLKPGILYFGNHHAREHLSAEVPLKLAEFLLTQNDAGLVRLLDERDVWIIPMVNPDGVEFDVATGKYKWWRKNRRPTQGSYVGVDLNRNYGFQWGGPGSSSDPVAETYRGPGAFSETESQAVRDFVRSHQNARMLLTFHTFSELILYPWGHKAAPISKAKDHAVFVNMAKTMVEWNHYTPEQASELYLASGDTTDWAYGELGMFAFTFELSPADQFEGGFYPGQGMINKVFDDNLKPCLYMLDLADNPYRAVPGAAHWSLPNLAGTAERPYLY